MSEAMTNDAGRMKETEAGSPEVRGLTEFEVIDLFSDRPPDPHRIEIGIGDDAAVVRTRGAVVITVDTAVDGIHFRQDWSRPEQIASKAIGAAVSDLAAMGAGDAGIEIYLSLGVPPGTEPDFLRTLARGVGEVAARHQITVAGGDTVASPVLFLAVTVTAHAIGADRLIRRSGAVPGDLVAVTGALGGARAGLWLLEHPDRLPATPGNGPDGLSDAGRQILLERQLDATPRLTAGLELARAGATAMADISDGLVADFGHIADASGVRIAIEGERIPVETGLAAVAAAAGVDPLDLTLSGGEDYELAVTLPPERLIGARQALADHGVELTAIGEVRQSDGPGSSGVTVSVDGEVREVLRTGYNHFV